MTSIATIAAAYSANKGAASMIQALVDGLRERLPEARIVAVSTHPAGDRRSYARADISIEVAGQRPPELVLFHLPLAALAGLLRLFRLPWRWVCRPAALRAIANADVVADVSGISFVEGRRRLLLVYNVVVVAVPLLLGRPVVKCAQALGPFTTRLNRTVARVVLSRVRTICPRGDDTAAHLRGLGLTNLEPAADLAFAMTVPESVRNRMRARLAQSAPGPYLTVAPSQVVATYCDQLGIDYSAILAEFIAAVTERTDHTVVLLAHAAQPEAAVNHMNDLPLCIDVYRRLASSERVVFFNEDLLPTELRALIGESRLVVTSRFHAMISALTEQVPVLVIGWSHKYEEVLAPFGLESAALTYADLSDAEVVVSRSLELLAQRRAIGEGIDRHLSRVRVDAQVNFDVLLAAVSDLGSPPPERRVAAGRHARR